VAVIDLDDVWRRIAENEAHGIYLSPLVKELLAELADLRMQRDEHLLDTMHALEEGRHLERKAVVAWLRGNRACCEHPSYVVHCASRQAADEIERGEHRGM
jgi:hypothetical protein